MSRRRSAAGMTLAAIGLLVAIAAIRVTAFGWAEVAPDDARYLFVGLSLLDGHGPVMASGSLFLFRAPLYPAVLAIGARIVGGDPVLGAHVMATGLALAGFALAVVLGHRLGGASAGVATAIVLAATPLLWRLLPTMRIDLTQAAAIIALLLALARPTPARWIVGGLVLAVAVLVKESSGTLALMPLAFAGTVPAGRLLRLSGLYLATAAIAAGWWWVVVYAQAGVIFPVNALGVIERRQVGADLAFGPTTLIVLAALAAGWLGLALRARRDARLRPLLLAGLLLVPPAAYATLNGLDSRNYAPLAVLSAVAGGSTLAAAIGHLGRRYAVGGRFAVPLGAALVALAVVAIAGSQAVVPRSTPQPLPDAIATWVRSHTEPGARVVMTFRYRELVALRLYGRNDVTVLNPRRLAAGDDPAGFAWIGLRDRQLFGYDREVWQARLGSPATRVFVVVTPHPLAPAALLGVLEAGGASRGLRWLSTVEPGGGSAAVFGVDPRGVQADRASLPLVLGDDAAGAWLDLEAADPSAPARFVAARPIVVGDAAAIAELTARLGSVACAAPAAETGVVGPAIWFLPAGDPACD